MKKIWFLLFAGILLATACDNDEPEPLQAYSTFGILDVATDTLMVITDNNLMYLVDNPEDISDSVETGDRIFISFTISDGPIPEYADTVITITSMQGFIVRDLIPTGALANDTLGADPLEVTGLWLSKDYLNINLNFDYYQMAHKFYASYDTTRMDGDTVYIEIHHDAQSDMSVNNYSTYMCFDLSPVQIEDRDSVYIRFFAQGYFNNDYESWVNYRY